METIKLKHNTDEWLEFRKSGIGGSDASAVLNANPYKTKRDLYLEKKGISEHKLNNPDLIEYGKNAELHLSKLFELDYPQYKVKIIKNKVFKNDFMFASIDAQLIEKATKRKGILEIKTATLFSSMSKEKWNNQVPQNYYIQLVHYFAVCDWAEFAVLKAQIKSTDNEGNLRITTKHYFWERADILEDIELLKESEKNFWENNMEKNIEPAFDIPEF